MVHEASEFMVRRVDGQIHPSMNSVPGSGFVYSGPGKWQLDTPDSDAAM